MAVGRTSIIPVPHDRNGVPLPEHRMFLAIRTMAYIGIPAHLLFIPMFLHFELPAMAVFNVFSVVIWCICWHLNQTGRHTFAIALMTFEAVLHAALATWFLGWYSNFQLYMMPIIPAIMFSERLRTNSILFVALALCLIFLTLNIITQQNNYGQYSGSLLDVIRLANIIIVFAGLGVITYYFRRGSEIVEQRMEELAGTDQLTHIPNRRRLQALLEIERVRSERKEHTFVVILADIDYFKMFNDDYGHDCGDFVLKNVARLLHQGMRNIDVVGRWGGEEFLVLLPESTLEHGINVAERLRKAVENEYFLFGGAKMHTTLTFGVALHSSGTALGLTLKRADAAMYAGKQAGRNCVMNGEADQSSEQAIA